MKLFILLILAILCGKIQNESLTSVTITGRHDYYYGLGDSWFKCNKESGLNFYFYYEKEGEAADNDKILLPLKIKIGDAQKEILCELSIFSLFVHCSTSIDAKSGTKISLVIEPEAPKEFIINSEKKNITLKFGTTDPELEIFALTSDCNVPCDLGYEKFKCANCKQEGDKCDSCNGFSYPNSNVFYQPDYETKYCYPCIEGTEENSCKTCSADKYECTECFNENYFPKTDAKCYQKCQKGPEELCKDCGTGDKQDKCGQCNDGYGLTNDEECVKICVAGTEENQCKNCGYDDNYGLNTFCLECHEGYGPINEGCVKLCVAGTEENQCETCKYSYGLPIECIKCHEGYGLKSDKTCVKLCVAGTEENQCETCKNDTDGLPIECIKCHDGYSLKPDKTCVKLCVAGTKENQCKTCENDSDGLPTICSACNDGYNLTNGECIEIDEPSSAIVLRFSIYILIFFIILG